MSIFNRKTTPITVSIVSHGHMALMRPLLDQLDSYSHAVIKKVVVTVNIPEHDQLAEQTWRFPVERIDNKVPKGFGANHNAAFAHCDSEWYLVLNPDIRIDDDVLTALERLACDGDGLLTPRIIEPGHRLPESHRALLTPFEILARHKDGYRAPAQPAWIPGMFMLFRAQAYRAIGGFDARYYMYGEDFDICARLRLAGWHIKVSDGLLVHHDAQRASQRNWKHLRWHVMSLAKVWLSRAFWQYRAELRRGG